MHFECDFSPFRIQTLTWSHTWNSNSNGLWTNVCRALSQLPADMSDNPGWKSIVQGTECNTVLVADCACCPECWQIKLLLREKVGSSAFNSHGRGINVGPLCRDPGVLHAARTRLADSGCFKSSQPQAKQKNFFRSQAKDWFTIHSCHTSLYVGRGVGKNEVEQIRKAELLSVYKACKAVPTSFNGEALAIFSSD